MPAPFVSRKILLVEDDDDLRRAYAAHLTANGFLVEEAEDVAAANQIFRATRRTAPIQQRALLELTPT